MFEEKQYLDYEGTATLVRQMKEYITKQAAPPFTMTFDGSNRAFLVTAQGDSDITYDEDDGALNFLT